MYDLRPRGGRPDQRLLTSGQSHQLLLLLLLRLLSSQSYGGGGLAENLAGGSGQGQLDIAGVEGGKSSRCRCRSWSWSWSWSRSGLTTNHLGLGLVSGRHLDQTVGSSL